jgi:3-oxoacyl-[acyl-carrier-protein] synthase II
MTGRRAVVTGMGLLTPLGKNVEENWHNLKAGRTGIGHYPDDRLPPAFQYVGRVGPFEPPAVAPGLSSQMKFLNRGSTLGFAAACEAFAQAGRSLAEIAPGRRALYIGSGDHNKIGHEFMHAALAAGAEPGNGVAVDRLNAAMLTTVNPFFLLESIANNLFSFLSASFEFRGPNTTLGTLSPFGAQALELAARSIEQGRADVALAVGCGSWIAEIPRYELEGLGLLSKCRLGARSFKPFDKSRDGFIPGEGGAAILLEAEQLVEKRGGAALARIAGSGNCIEFTEGLGVSPEVVARSVRQALGAAGCGTGDLAFLCAHGSATRKGDRSELMSLLEVFQGGGAAVPLCGLKPYTGHMGAASDLAEIILSVEAIAQGLVPATLNFTEADREFAALKISCRHQPCTQGSFLSLSYGIGGQSSAIVVSVQS